MNLPTIFYFCDKGSLFLKDSINVKNIEVISNLNDFRKLDSKKLKKAFGIIIIAEIKWNNIYYSDLFGLQLVKKIRSLFQCALPILIVSYSGLDSRISRSGNMYTTSYSHYFKDHSVKLISVEELLNLREDRLDEFFPAPLNDYQLADFTITLYDDARGFLSEFIHELKYKFSEFRVKSKTELEKVLDTEFISLRKMFPHKTTLIDSALKEFISEQIINISNSSIGITPLLDRIKERLLKNRDLSKRKHSPIEKIKVLYIDDDEKCLLELKKRLFNYGVNCLTCSSLDSASTILAENQDIKIVISDYRFYDDDGRFSKYQGYDIVRELIANGYKHAVIMLTGFDEVFHPRMHALHREVQYSKEVIFSQSNSQEFTLFYQMLIELNTKEIFEHFPDFADPTYYFYYRHYCKAKDYILKEQKLNKEALLFVSNFNILNSHVAGDTNGSTQLEFDENPSPHLTSLNTILDKDKDHAEVFYDKLRARRIIIGLWQSKGIDRYLEPRLTPQKERSMRWRLIMRIVYYGQLTDILKTRKINDNNFYSLMKRLGFKTHSILSVDNHDEINELKILREEKDWLLKNLSTLKG